MRTSGYVGRRRNERLSEPGHERTEHADVFDAQGGGTGSKERLCLLDVNSQRSGKKPEVKHTEV